MVRLAPAGGEDTSIPAVPSPNRDRGGASPPPTSGRHASSARGETPPASSRSRSGVTEYGPAPRGDGVGSGRLVGDARWAHEEHGYGTRTAAQMTAVRTDFAGREHPRAGSEPASSPSCRASPSCSSTSGSARSWPAAPPSASIRGPASNSVPRVGGTKTVRLDRLRELRPTHVIVNVDENRRSDVDAIESFTPNVVVTHPLGPGTTRGCTAFSGRSRTGGGGGGAGAGNSPPGSMRCGSRGPIAGAPGAVPHLEGAVDDGVARHLHLANALPGQLGDRRARRERSLS